MVRSVTLWSVATLALVFAVSSADAQTVRRHQHHAQAHYVVPPGDIVVHARSYLDSGVGASYGEIGTGNRYVTDSAPASLGQEGSTFGARAYETLPTLFNPPGRPEPLFVF
jgi:hypothetical protein